MKCESTVVTREVADSNVRQFIEHTKPSVGDEVNYFGFVYRVTEGEPEFVKRNPCHGGSA